MYFANNKGLLEFDGSDWSLYSTRNAKTRAVNADSNGFVYVGGLHQFGYFKPNSLGGMDYICLSDSVDGSKIGNIWNIHILKDEVCFQSDNGLFYWDGQRLLHVPLLELNYSALVNGNLYVASSAGLFVVKKHKLILLPDTQSKFNNTNGKVVGIYSYGKQLLVITARNGIFLYDNGKWTTFHSAADSYIKSNLLHSSAMNDSLLALGTVLDGVLLLNVKTDKIEHISMKEGLQNKTVLSLSYDKNENLWLGLDNGIDCVHLQYPIRQLNEAVGSGYASCIYQGKLYLGTNQRLYKVDNYLDDDCRIHPVEGPAGQIYSLAVYGNELFCAGANSLYVVDGDHTYQVQGTRGVWEVTPLWQKDKMLIGTYTGFFLLKKVSGRWVVDRPVKGRRFSSKSLYVNQQKNMAWTANKEDGLYCISFSETADSVIGIKCLNSEMLPKGDNVCIASINNEVVVASRYGLFRYNSLAGALERYEWLENALDGRKAYTYIQQDSLQNIWYVTGGSLKLLRYDSSKRRYYREENELYLKNSLTEDFEHIQVLDGKKALIGMEDGFSLLDFSKPWIAESMFDLQIRKVYLTGAKDSLIYGCSGFLPDDKELKIPYKRNSIKIEYNANVSDELVTLNYACRLDGPVSEAWYYQGDSKAKEYTALPEGHYTFYVRACLGQDTIVGETSFSFDILPPWYRTWWSYLIYLSLVGLVLYYAYYRLVDGRKQLLMQKELELYHQKEIFQKESELNDKKISSLKEEKLQAELNYKSEELLRSTMNIVRKNEILLEIKREVMGFSASIKDGDMVSLRRKTVCLLGQINTNLDHDDDMLNFQKMFDSVHNDFFRILEKKYPDLSRKEKLLCAYIHMNLLSKEMAPLLNISLRGVEISRYRLRKKLNLAEGENLAEFLQKLSM